MLEPRGHLLVEPRRGHEPGGVLVDSAFPRQIAEEGPDRGELARDGGAGNTVFVKLGEKSPDGQNVDAAPSFDVERRFGESAKLKKIRTIILYGMRGEPTAMRQVFEKRVYRFR